MSDEAVQGDELRLTKRAERFLIEAALRYRASGDDAWHEGKTLNISRTGVLFKTSKGLHAKTMLEMRIVFPAEIYGGTPADLVCWGPIVRIQQSDASSVIAAAILRYRFKRNAANKKLPLRG
jgi:hypothetical protein